MSNFPEKGRLSLRKGRVFLPDQAYYITKCVSKEKEVTLCLSGFEELIMSTLLWARDQGWCRILGFVIMPDHYHVAIALYSSKTLSEIMDSIGKFTARKINALLGRKGAFWEDGYYEHAIRDREDFDGILNYIHNNPVKEGLSESIDSWEFSTANPKYANEIDWEWLGPSF